MSQESESEKMRRQLATTSVKRGLVQRELIEKTKGTRPTPETSHPSNVTQADIHFQAIMGSDFKKYDTPEKKVDAFDLIYGQLFVPMSDTARQQFTNMLTEESRHPGKYVFYHGALDIIGFATEVITEFRQQLELHYAGNIQILRAFDDAFDQFKNVTEMMTNLNYDLNKGYRAIGLSVNPFPFGSDGFSGEATYYYFLQNVSKEAPTMEALLNDFFKRLHLDVDLTIFKTLFDQFYKNAGGVCYQFFVDASCIDKVAKPAVEMGRQNPLHTAHGTLETFSDVIEELRKNPKKHATYIKKLQARVYLDPDVLHDPDKVDIKTYRTNPLSPAQEKEYQSEMRKAVTDQVTQLLVAQQKLPSTAFKRAKGKPGLHRQVDMVYKAFQLPASKTHDIKTLILALTTQDDNVDLSTLINAIINTPDLDLDNMFSNDSYGTSIRLWAFFKGSIAARVYVALQPHNDKPHIAKVLQQIKSAAWCHFVSIGDLNLDKVRELFDPEHSHRSVFLDLALKLAVEHHQVKTVAWLLEKGRELKHKFVDGLTLLKTVVEKGHHEIVTQLLPIVDEKYLTALYFADLLSLAKKHKNPAVTAIILAKLKTMPPEISERLPLDDRALIPALLAEGKVSDVVQIIVSTESCDLFKPLIIDNKVRTLLDVFSDHIDVSEKVLAELQQSDKAHVAKVVKQLHAITWYQQVKRGDLTQVEKLFESDHPLRTILLNRALNLAVEHDRVNTLAWLLDKCRAFNGKADEISLLRIAIEKGRTNSVKYILSVIEEKKLDPDTFFKLLLAGAKFDRVEIIELILDKLKMMPREVAERVLIQNRGDSLLCQVVAKGYNSVLQKVLRDFEPVGTSLSKVSDEYAKGLLAIAIENGHADIVRTLLQTPDAVNLSHYSKLDPLLLAAKRNDIPILKLLLEHMKYIDDKVDQYEKNPLMIAAELGYAEFVTTLLSDPRTHNLSRKTKTDHLDALSLAAKRGHTEVVRLLLDKKWYRHEELKTVDFKTALLQAAKFNHTDAFMCIAQSEYCPVELTTLVAAAVEINNRNALPNVNLTTIFSMMFDYGETTGNPLPGRFELAMFLIERGADSNIVQEMYKNKLFEMLKDDGHEFVIGLLEKYIRKTKVPKAMRSFFQDRELHAAKCLLNALKNPSSVALSDTKSFHEVLIQGELGRIYQLCEPLLVAPETGKSVRVLKT